MEDVKLTSFEGLGMIPFDILQLGSRRIVQYMLDLFGSPEADPLYRTKLMVVGFESVGKTTFLDCLFPLEAVLIKKGLVTNNEFLVRLQGCILQCFKDKGGTAQVIKVILENRQWDVATVPKVLGIKLTPRRKGEDKEMEFYFADKDTHETWLARLKRACMNEATHGIDIHTLEIDNSITRDYFEGQGRPGKLEVSVWDFAGQHEYYNNHHYFLTARTVFLVLWKMNEGEQGLKGLEFWFRSLAAHLVGTTSGPGTYFSVMVVGTFLDHPSV